jgi:hypothetical protein
MAFTLTPKQQQDMFAAAIFTHVNRARRFDPNYLKPRGIAELTLSWRDVHNDKLVSLPIVVRTATQQMVGAEGESSATTFSPFSDQWPLHSLQLKRFGGQRSLVRMNARFLSCRLLMLCYVVRYRRCRWRP